MSAAFDRAAIPKPFKVLGRGLKPFSIGHEILLTASGNGFAQSSSEEYNGDPDKWFAYLTLAIRICRQDYYSAINDVIGGNLKFRLWLFLLLQTPFVLDIELMKFRAYLNHYRRGPEFTRKSEIARSSVGAPFEYVLKSFLCVKMGLSVEEALNYPYCTAIADYLTYLETKGALHVVDSIEEFNREAMAIHKEIIAKAQCP